MAFLSLPLLAIPAVVLADEPSASQVGAQVQLMAPEGGSIEAGALPALPALPAPTRAPSPARRSGYVALGVEGSVDLYFNGAAVAEGGVRLGASAFSVHALVGRGQFSGGGWSPPEGSGRYKEYRAGIEADRCASGSLQRQPALCGFVGLDLGYVSQTSDTNSARRTAKLGVARIGADVGLDRIRLRVALDLRNGSDHTGTADSEPAGAGITGTLAIQF